MYINHLPWVTKYCEVHLYADDTLLFFESSSVQAIEAAVPRPRPRCQIVELSHVKLLKDQSYVYGNPPKPELCPVI